MKRLLPFIISVLILLPVAAQTVVRDAQDGQPVIQASVYDEQGKIIGVTDADGLLPDVGGSKAIRLTHIAYRSLDVQTEQIGAELRMHPVTYSIKPVVVESKKDAYCLKLMCYYRQYMVNGKGTVDELPPVVSFVDGICNLYVFTDDYKTTRQVQLAKRQVISNDMESSTTDEELPGITIHSLPERYREAVDKSPYTFQQDSTRHVINTTFSALYPDKSRLVRLNILGSNSKYQTVASPTMVKNLHQAVHQQGPYAKVSQGDLLAYSEVRQLKGTMKQRGREKYAMNLWLFDEYFPVEATLMTKQEYKAEQRHRQKSSQMLSPDDIDRYINEQHIPELSSDIQQKLEMTRKRQGTMVTPDGQRADAYKDLPQERIYLQTDKPYYAAGDTVWLRAHLMDAETNEPVSRSRFVYVELHDQQADTLMQRMTINGFFGVRPVSYSGKVPGVLFVFLKDGSEIVKARAKDRLSFVTVRQMGYRWPVEFYSPQYPLEDKSQYSCPDHRTTLYWNPKVTTDADGHATVRFYASDVSTRYLVTLEGFSNDGTIVHRQQVIE